MHDFKSMYYYLAGRMASAIDTLEASTEMLEANTKALEATNTANATAIDAITQALDANSKAIAKIKEKLKAAQLMTEEMFMNSGENDVPGNEGDIQ